MLGHETCRCSALQETQLSKLVKSIFMSANSINCSLCSPFLLAFSAVRLTFVSICWMDICISLWFKLLFFWLLMSLCTFPCVCWPLRFYLLWSAWYICYFSFFFFAFFLFICKSTLCIKYKIPVLFIFFHLWLIFLFLNVIFWLTEFKFNWIYFTLTFVFFQCLRKSIFILWP